MKPKVAEMRTISGNSSPLTCYQHHAPRLIKAMTMTCEDTIKKTINTFGWGETEVSRKVRFIWFDEHKTMDFVYRPVVYFVADAEHAYIRHLKPIWNEEHRRETADDRRQPGQCQMIFSPPSKKRE